MPGNTHNLLSEPWISTVDADGQRVQHSLPEVLQALGNGNELEFSGLQGHQRQAWYAFLVQLSALVIARVGGAVTQDATHWHDALLELTGGNINAWHLVVDDLAQPAFFQPPVPEGHLKAFKRTHSTPAILDVRIAAKNFDVKADLYGQVPTAEPWAYALVTLQTMEGFLGRGNYGIARMNGGFSSRPEAALSRSAAWGQRLTRDVSVLLKHRDVWLDTFQYSDNGHALTWLKPWQGEKSLVLSALDPFYVEICRRVRLQSEGEMVVAHLAPSKVARIHAKENLGNVGDPWTPIRTGAKDQPTALTVSERGFHYRLVHELLFGASYQQPAAMELQEDDQGAVWASFRALVRGQGKTGGYHERHVLIPGEVVPHVGRPKARDPERSMAFLSEGRIQLVGELSKKLLKPALLRLTQERVGKDAGDLNWRDNRPQPWLNAFDQAVDDTFFDRLFKDFISFQQGDEAQEEAIRAWHRHLYDLMRHQLHDAIDVLAPSGVHRYRAIARATSFFEGSARKSWNLLPSEPTVTVASSTGSDSQEATK